MKVIVEQLDLARMWGRDKDISSVITNTYPEGSFTVRLNCGEMLPLVYRIDVGNLQKLESLNGSADVVIISKQEKGGKIPDTEKHYYNEVITSVLTISEYMSVKKKQVGYQSRFAAPAPPKRDRSTSEPYHEPLSDGEVEEFDLDFGQDLPT